MAEKFTELFKMFCADVKDEVAKLCGFDVEVRDVTKNNGVKRKGLYFGEGRYSPIIYLEPYFDIKFIKNKEAINDIANQIYEIYKENKAETKKYDVENIPAVTMFINGKIDATRTGFQPKEIIEAWIESKL